MAKVYKEIDLQLLTACLKANESFTIKQLHERMSKLCDMTTVSVLRRKIVDLHNQGATTRVVKYPAVYQCSERQLKLILEIHKEPKIKVTPNPTNVKSMNWHGAKIIGKPGDTILMIGCAE